MNVPIEIELSPFMTASIPRIQRITQMPVQRSAHKPYLNSDLAGFPQHNYSVLKFPTKTNKFDRSNCEKVVMGFTPN